MCNTAWDNQANKFHSQGSSKPLQKVALPWEGLVSYPDISGLFFSNDSVKLRTKTLL